MSGTRTVINYQTPTFALCGDEVSGGVVGPWARVEVRRGARPGVTPLNLRLSVTVKRDVPTSLERKRDLEEDANPQNRQTDETGVRRVPATLLIVGAA